MSCKWYLKFRITSCNITLENVRARTMGRLAKLSPNTVSTIHDINRYAEKECFNGKVLGLRDAAKGFVFTQSSCGLLENKLFIGRKNCSKENFVLLTTVELNRIHVFCHLVSSDFLQIIVHC